MPTPPSLQKVNPADQPILFLALGSDTLPLSQVNEYAETVIAQRLSTVTGVAQVNIQGAQKFAVRIDLDPRELASRQIGIDQVAQAVQQANSNLPTGTLAGPRAVVRRRGRRQADVRGRPTRRSSSPTATARPCASTRWRSVFDGVENDKTAAYQRRRATVFVSIQRQPGANTVADRRLDSRAAAGAAGAAARRRSRSDVRSDRSKSIRESVADVKFTLMLTMGLVVLVIFLFLRNISATVIPSLALPVSVVGTFAVMYAFGYSLDNLSLMALTLAVGFVVDDAIVMLENIVRHMELGKSPMEAAFAGSQRGGVHHSVDDRVAGGGVHPGALHGRHRRPADARVRGHDRRGHPGVGRRVGHADADAVQPVPEAARTKRIHGALFRADRARVRSGAGRPTRGRCGRRCASARWRWRCRWRSSPAPYSCSRRCRPGSSRARTPARFRPRPRACRASASRRCGATSCEAAEIVAARSERRGRSRA